MAERGKAPAGRPMTLVWMVLALVVVGGFLTWLGMVSEPTSVIVVDDYDDENGEPGEPGSVTTVHRDTLAENTARFAGQRVRVERVASTGRLGPAIFWGELGDMERQMPILVRVDPDLAARFQLESGVEYTITGQVQQITEALVEEWAEQGEFTGEGEQLQATFADYYIQASAIRPSGAPAARGS
jgi:hypothetical protein